MRALLLSLAVLLAGCVGSSASPPLSPAAARDDPEDGPRNATIALRNVTNAWDGVVEQGAFLCEGVTESCQGYATSEGTTSWLVEDLDGATVTAVHATLTWTASSPATEVLGFGVMIMVPDCADCEGISLADVDGASPLTIALDGLNATLERGAVVHFYAWNAGGGAGLGPAFLGASPTSDPVHAEATVVLAEVVEPEE